MSGLDIILGGILIYGIGRGLWKGLFVELASLVSLVIGIYIAIHFSYLVRDIIGGWVESWSPKNIEIVSFALTFILVVVAIILSAKFFTKIADFASLGWLNRLAGGVFGLFKMVLMLSVVLNLFQKINYNNLFMEKETADQSLFFNPILQVSATIFPMIEEWFTPKSETPDKTK